MVKEMKLESFDGTKLYVRLDQWVRENSEKAVIILIHGLCEHSGRYDYVTSRLTSAGYKVYRFDHRGHGKSEGSDTFYNSYEEIGNDVKSVFNRVKAHNPGKKVFIMGHSMGGHACASFGTRFPGSADGFVLLGAITRQTSAKEGEFPIKEKPSVYIDNSFEEGLCANDMVFEDYANDPLVKKKISIGLLNSVWEGTRFLKKNAKSFKEPVLVLHGCDDGIVSEKDSREFYGDIASKDKTLKIYPGLCHELLNERCRDLIIDDILCWLDAHV